MTDFARLANLAEILSAIIVVGGIFFAVLQMRQTRQQRRELAAVEELRVEIDDPGMFEWFQWLATKLEEFHDDPTRPAYVAHSDWKPLNRSNDL
jgi:uncharacterized membrane protein